jgi:HEAT repeat protein
MRNKIYAIQRRSLVLFIAVVAATVGGSEPARCAPQSTTQEAELIAVLESDAPPADKAMACKRLAVHGTAAAIPALSELLPDPELSSWARIALETIPDAAADRALVSALEKLQGLQHIGAINSLGARRTSQAVEALSRILSNSKDDATTAAAARALGRIGNQATAGILREALSDSRSEVRSAVAEACVLAAEQLAEDKDSAAAAELFAAVRNADVPQQVVLEASRGLILTDAAKGQPLLLEALATKDKKLFQLGLSVARELPGDNVTSAMSELLSRASPERQILLLQVLADRNDPDGIPAYLRMISSPRMEVRMEALRAIGQAGDASCLQPVIEIALGDENADVVAAARQALKAVGEKSIDDRILSIAAQAQGAERLLLVELIGARQIDARKILMAAMKDQDSSIRAAALRSFGAISGPSDLPLLIERIVVPQSKDESEAALAALNIAAVRMPNPDDTVRQLEKAMPQASSAAQKSLLKSIGAVGGGEALRAIHAAAKGDDDQLRDVASELLGGWMSADAAPVLLDLARNSSESKYRIRALRGYLRIARQFDMSDAERFGMCQQALQVAERDEEKKLISEVLERYATLETLKLAINSEQEALRREAATAMASAIVQRSPEQKDEVEAVLGGAIVDSQ